MTLADLWEGLFSEDISRVKEAWQSLTGDERGPVKDLLVRIVGERDRIDAQRAAARYALAVVDDVLPDGALAFAQDIGRETGQFLVQTHGQMTASLKRDGTLVTASDLESDRRLSEAIRARYPAHAILSEEREVVYRSEEWCWLIDPIDGTTNFTWGFPMWGVLLALLHFGQPVLGVADFPLLGEQYSAARGQGAWLGGTRLRTAHVPTTEAGGVDPMPTQLFASCTRSLGYGPFNVPLKVRVPGTTGYDLATVARGACVGSIDMRVHVWDVAALWPILHEAGAVMAVNRTTPLFPLQPDRDYLTESYSVLSACSEGMLGYLRHRLSDRFVIKE